MVARGHGQAATRDGLAGSCATTGSLLHFAGPPVSWILDHLLQESAHTAPLARSLALPPPARYSHRPRPTTTTVGNVIGRPTCSQPRALDHCPDGRSRALFIVPCWTRSWCRGALDSFGVLRNLERPSLCALSLLLTLSFTRTNGMLHRVTSTHLFIVLHTHDSPAESIARKQARKF